MEKAAKQSETLAITPNFYKHRRLYVTLSSHIQLVTNLHKPGGYEQRDLFHKQKSGLVVLLKNLVEFLGWKRTDQ